MSFDTDPGEQAQISASDFAQMCDEMKRLKDRNAELEAEAESKAPKPIATGGPAFPQPLSFSPQGNAHLAGEYFCNTEGMTLRDWFAGMALQGLCMNPPTETEALTDCASLAYNIADAMLAARKEEA